MGILLIFSSKSALGVIYFEMFEKKISSQGQMFPCLQCNFKSSKPSNLRNHLMNKHAFKKATEVHDVAFPIHHPDVREEKIRFSCDQCDHVSTKKLSLKLHIQ